MFDPHSGRCVVSLSKVHLPPKVLVIPRMLWLRPDMTEKFFTGTLSKRKKTTKKCKLEFARTPMSLFRFSKVSIF